MDDPTPNLPALRRRQLLRGAAALSASGGVVSAAGLSAAVGAESLPAWSDPATWGSTGVPAPGTHVTLTSAVRLDVDVFVSGLAIECGARLVFDPDRSVTLRSTGNVEVCGLLEMRPTGPDIDHLLRFEGIDESQFQGGGKSVIDSDIGLWIVHEGRVELHGSPRTPWVRARGALTHGATHVALAAIPVGWRPGDLLVITPTGVPADQRHFERFDEVRIQSIEGQLVRLDRGLSYGHPSVDVGDGYVMTAEVINLTRNVRIEGTPGGRTHSIALHVTQPSHIAYAAFRHFGPRQPVRGDRQGRTQFVTGRYGFHWHMCGDGSRGAVMEGVVMRDGGSHAYVPHFSNGVTHRSCVSYDTFETPFWWDRRESHFAASPPTHDVTYDSCVAARVKSDPEWEGYRLAGFNLGTGSGNKITDCVAVGVLGNVDSSGFNWPEDDLGIWEFFNCVAHNNKVHGIHVWQNPEEDHSVDQFVGYHNGGAGIFHGAYINGYTYRNSILFGNRGGGVQLHAVSRSDATLKLDNLLIDCAGQSQYAIESIGHVLPPAAATRISRCRLRGYTSRGIALTGARAADRTTQPDLIDVVSCEFSGKKFWIARKAHRRSRLRWFGPKASLLLRHPRARAGRLSRSWNSRTSRIAPFAGTAAKPGPTGITVKRLAP